MAEPVDVVPLPPAAIDRPALEQVVRQGDVVVLYLTAGAVDPVNVILPRQILGPLGSDLRLLLRPFVGSGFGLS
jgi:hypothetical protein